jgi:hypothetical protein
LGDRILAGLGEQATNLARLYGMTVFEEDKA